MKHMICFKMFQDVSSIVGFGWIWFLNIWLLAIEMVVAPSHVSCQSLLQQSQLSQSAFFEAAGSNAPISEMSNTVRADEQLYA